mmetsp:Transcript_21061/g.81578  ORF Transcript_21061/g.81578 Transcript_21061/m.81578 type:complete len:451 (-) Transcript_21061:3205-4557(-)
MSLGDVDPGAHAPRLNRGGLGAQVGHEGRGLEEAAQRVEVQLHRRRPSGSLEHFEHAGRAHAAADAHRHADTLGTAALAFDEGVAGQALARHTVGVADRDRAAVDVELVHRDAQCVGAVQHLNREGLVEFPQVDVGDGQAQLLQHLGHGEHRADAHFIGLAAGDGKAQEAAQRLEVVRRGVLLADQRAGARAVAELAGIAGADDAAGQRGAQVLDALKGRALAQAFVGADGDLFAHQAHDLVRDTHRRGHRDHLVSKLASGLRRTGLLLAGGAIVVHALARDLVALSHVLGGLQHGPVDLGLELDQRRVREHVLVHFLLHAGDALDAAGHIHIALARDDALRGHRDGLQPAGAEAIDGDAAHRDRQAGLQRDLARDVGAGGALGVGAAHQHVFDGAGLDARALDGGRNGPAAERGAVGHVEGALPALGQRGAGGGDDQCVAHVLILGAIR